jgi:hypothetical protein
MFAGDIIHMVGLMKITLPLTTIRLCDGGHMWWGADKYTSDDATYGAVGGLEAVDERISDEAPATRITLLPPSVTTAADLFLTNAQSSPVEMWLGEYDPATGAVTGTPEKVFSGRIDAVNLRIGKTERAVEIDIVSEAERLFMNREGNVLSTRFHQTAWPGELGFEHATGAQVAVPWGVAGPGRGAGIPFFGSFITFAHNLRTGATGG